MKSPMNILPMLFLSTTMFASFSYASGLGWSARSFDWAKYEADKNQLDASVKKCSLTSEEPRWCGEQEMVKRFIGTRGQKASSVANYDIKDAVLPLNFEYFSVPFVSEAYEVQSTKVPLSLFGLFKNGRSEWKGQWTGCDAYPDRSWDCTNAYVVMRPSEVKAIKKEIDDISSKNPVVKYEYFQLDLSVLKEVVDIASKENRALFFYAQD